MSKLEKHLDLDIKLVDGIQVITAKGHIDHSNTAEFNKFKNSIDEKNNLLLLDLSGVKYISSAFIHSLISFESLVRKNKGKMAIVIQSDFVLSVIALTGGKLRHKIFHFVEEATNYLKEP